MNSLIFLILIAIIYSECSGQMIYETGVNFRVEPGSKTCFYEKGKVGQVMEVYYQVLDGKHGDLDISFDVIDPNAVKLLSDYKKSQNSVIMDLDVDGEYSFCLDNTYSLMNYKLVFVYVVIENKEKEENQEEVEVAVEGEEGEEEKGVLEWTGTDENGKEYFLEVSYITQCLSRILKHVLKARHMLDIYSATKSRDSYVATEDTFIVDVWSSVQISLMFVVGMLQVYTIKKLFKPQREGYKSMF